MPDGPPALAPRQRVRSGEPPSRGLLFHRTGHRCWTCGATLESEHPIAPAVLDLWRAAHQGHKTYLSRHRLLLAERHGRRDDVG